ncbi:Serine/threonine protein kinase [Tribonema minus]|uniref:Serine/threonine protein kinase n=1 Tax=Tribonema minus TaxID=303371 RepID=A0A835YYP7_9STRA|nr:Serine/threonine protein kinase [Tribonema minus]
MSGKVKLGRDPKDNSLVAIKLIYLDTMSARAAQHLQREVQAMMKLQHPNIMQLKDFYNTVYTKKNGQQRQVAALVLELAEAGELFEFVMHTGSFPDPLARTLFSQLTSAMVQCHANGVSHRDLKPENVLLDGRFQLKVADFGLAAVMDSTDSGAMCVTKCGTRSYMAPEVLAGRRAYDPTKADVWSAGVVLFIMIAGNPPFEEASSTDWWYLACRCGRYDRFWAAHLRTCPDFPTLAQDLLNKIFVEDPTKRPTFEQIREHPWLKEGPVWEPAQLEMELRQRLARVQTSKALQKQRELIKKRQKRAGTNAHDPFADNVERSAAALSRSLVPAAVLNTPRALMATLYSSWPLDQLLAAVASALSSCAHDSSANAHEDGDEGATPTEPVLDAPAVTVKEQSAKVKALFPLRQVEVVAHVYGGDDANGGLLLVNLTKLQGDAWRFDAIRRAVIASLEQEGAICSNDAASTSQDASDVFDADEALEGDVPTTLSVGSHASEEIELI